MNIKMICSDLDGTLLQYGRKTLEREIYSDRSTGGPGHSVLPGVGAAVYQPAGAVCAGGRPLCLFVRKRRCAVQGRDLHWQNTMPRALAEEIARDMWERSEGQGEVMLSGQNCAYLMERGLGMLDRVRFIGNNYRMIRDPAEVPEEIVKVSVYLHEGVGAYVDRFVPRWQQANCAVAGPYWIDTTLANKGTGVQALCGALGIDPAQVMAFGDNYNDTTMLDLVGVPYIMDGAAAELRERYTRHTPRPEDILRRVLAGETLS